MACTRLPGTDPGSMPLDYRPLQARVIVSVQRAEGLAASGGAAGRGVPGAVRPADSRHVRQCLGCRFGCGCLWRCGRRRPRGRCRLRSRRGVGARHLVSLCGRLRWGLRAPSGLADASGWGSRALRPDRAGAPRGRSFPAPRASPTGGFRHLEHMGLSSDEGLSRLTVSCGFGFSHRSLNHTIISSRLSRLADRRDIRVM